MAVPIIAAAAAAKGIGIAGAAGISALGSIGSSIISNIGGRKAQNRANRQNIEFWNMQNKYNHPSSQMERLRSAGLNPNLVYGQGGGLPTSRRHLSSKTSTIRNEKSYVRYRQIFRTKINRNQQ